MLWLLTIIIAYIFFAWSALVDKYILVKIAMSPQIYVFYIGILGILIFLLVPFVGFVLPSPFILLVALGSGATLTYGVLKYLEGLRVYETSRIVSTIGGLVPVFTYLMIFVASKGHESFSLWQFVSFAFLIAGTVLITLEKGKPFNSASLRISVVSAFFTALSFLMAKYVYEAMPFWSGLMLIRLGAFFVALWLLISSREVQKEFAGKIAKKPPFWQSPWVALVFFSSQVVGALAELLRNIAVFIAPLLFLSFIHALQGIQYVIVFLLAWFFSVNFPHVMKEEVKPHIVSQKIIAICSILIGLVILALYEH